MSRAQWGHGYHTARREAMKKNQTQGPFPVGFFFHVLEDGKINKQGIVIGASGETFLVRFFSWIDGGLLEQVMPFSRDDMTGWKFYETDRDLRVAYAKAEHWSQEDIESEDRLVVLFS